MMAREPEYIAGGSTTQTASGRLVNPGPAAPAGNCLLYASLWDSLEPPLGMVQGSLRDGVKPVRLAQTS
jgi:hypothetical protein